MNPLTMYECARELVIRGYKSGSDGGSVARVGSLQEQAEEVVPETNGVVLLGILSSSQFSGWDAASRMIVQDISYGRIEECRAEGT